MLKIQVALLLLHMLEHWHRHFQVVAHHSTQSIDTLPATVVHASRIHSGGFNLSYYACKYNYV